MRKRAFQTIGAILLHICPIVAMAQTLDNVEVGSVLVYEAKVPDGQAIDAALGESLTKALESRMAAMNIANATTRVSLESREVTIRIKGGGYLEDTAKKIGKSNQVEIRILNTIRFAKAPKAPYTVSVLKGKPPVFKDSKGEEIKAESVLDKSTLLFTNKDIAKGSSLLRQGDQFGISIKLSPTAQKKLASYTKANIGKWAAIIIDGNIVSAFQINSQITNGIILYSGIQSKEEAERLIEGMNSLLPIAIEFKYASTYTTRKIGK